MFRYSEPWAIQGGSHARDCNVFQTQKLAGHSGYRNTAQSFAQSSIIIELTGRSNYAGIHLKELRFSRDDSLNYHCFDSAAED